MTLCQRQSSATLSLGLPANLNSQTGLWPLVESPLGFCQDMQNLYLYSEELPAVQPDGIGSYSKSWQCCRQPWIFQISCIYYMHAYMGCGQFSSNWKLSSPVTMLQRAVLRLNTVVFSLRRSPFPAEMKLTRDFKSLVNSLAKVVSLGVVQGLKHVNLTSSLQSLNTSICRMLGIQSHPF